MWIKQYFSDLLDIIISFSPALSYYLLMNYNLVTYISLEIQELTAIIYLAYCILIIVVHNAKTVGNALLKINIVSTKNGELTKLGFLIRSTVISIIIFLFPLNESFDLTMILAILILVAPIRVVQNNFVQYSLLNSLIRVTFIDVHNDKKKNS